MSYINYENGYSLFRSVGNAIKGQEGLLSETVGWTGKNLLAIPASVVTTTINDVDFTVNRNANGEVTSIVANGTASNDAVLRIAPHTVNAPTYGEELPIARGNYKYSCLSSAGSDSTYFSTVIARTSSEASRGVIGTDRGSGATFTVSNDTTRIEFNITIKKNQQVSNVAFYPMLMDARISDSTYEPHHESVDACKYNRSEANVLGAKNLLYNKASSGSQNNVTWTVASDGSVTVNTGEGGASANTTITLSTNAHYDYSVFRGKTFRLQGAPSSADANKYLELYIASPQAWNRDTGDGKIVTMPDSASVSFNFNITIKSGATASNMVFKPMFCFATDTDSTYAPYAMTNRELTTGKLQIGKELSSSDNLNNITDSGIYGVSSSPTNSPESLSYYILIVKEYTGGLVQVAFRQNVMYSRRANIEGSTVSWTHWFKYIGTEVV